MREQTAELDNLMWQVLKEVRGKPSVPIPPGDKLEQDVAWRPVPCGEYRGHDYKLITGVEVKAAMHRVPAGCEDGSRGPRVETCSRESLERLCRKRMTRCRNCKGRWIVSKKTTK